MNRPPISRPASRAVRRWAPLALVLPLLTGLLSACDFDGAYDLPLPGGVDPEQAYEVTAEFDDVLSVVPKSPVRVDDVTVGEVVEVERTGWNAIVTLRIRNDVTLPDNATADIQQVSLLGGKYVSLEEPIGAPQGRLEDGDAIPRFLTGRNPQVEEVLGALSFVLNGGGIAQLGTITSELNDAMSGRTRDLRELLGSLDRVVGTLDQQKADIIRAMQSINNLTKTLNAEKETITDALDVAGPAVRVLDQQHEELIGMLGALDRLGQVGTRVIRASKDDLLSVLADLRPVLRNLNKAGDKLAPGLNLLASFPFPEESSEIVFGDFANTSFKLDVNLDNLLENGTIPELPDLPGPLPDLGALTPCLTSEGIQSKECDKLLSEVALLPALMKACQKQQYRDTPVCRSLKLAGDVGGLFGGNQSGDPGDDRGNLLGDLGLGGFGMALSSGAPSPQPGREALFGGAL